MQKICIAFRLTFQIDKFYCQKPIIAEVRHQTQQFLFFCFQCNTIREICSVHRFPIRLPSHAGSLLKIQLSRRHNMYWHFCTILQPGNLQIQLHLILPR